MFNLRTLCLAATFALTAPGVAFAGGNGLGFPDAGSSIRQLNQKAVDRFNNSSSKIRRSQRQQQQRRKAREQAFSKERLERRKKRDLEREINQRP